MAEPTIVCPKCKASIKLTESLAAPILEAAKADFEERLRLKDEQVDKKEKQLKKREDALQRERDELESQLKERLEERLHTETARITKEEAKKAQQAISAELKEKERSNAQLQELLKAQDQKLAEAQRQQADLLRKTRELEDAKREVELTVERRVSDLMSVERQKARKDAEAEAKKAHEGILADLREKESVNAELLQTLKKRDEKLAQAQQEQADLMRKTRELEEAKRDLALTVEKRVAAEIGAARDKARQEAEDSLRLRVAEKEQTISAMTRQIEELKRKAEQGSQQLQGEVQELELESVLRMKFPRDVIEPVPKGEHGGDVLQRVVNNLGQICGMILWESKRTKAWSDTWLPKLRDDQRAAKAEIAVIVSQVLPKDVDNFGLVDGVWICQPRALLPVGMILRQGLIDVAAVRMAKEGQQTKMEMIYEYLTGTRFRQRVQALVESFGAMKDDLDREKKALMKQWAKREEELSRALEATVGLYGDLQGMAGKSIKEIEGLDLKMLGDGNVGGQNS